MKKVKLLDLVDSLYRENERKELFSWIMCGKVKVDGETIRDPKRLVPSDCIPHIALRNYVSRGGFKLEKCLSLWNIDVRNKGFLDAGCSTGGFTDCLLQAGASFVHAVDVGYNQLHYSLRINEKVHVHEKTNIMHIESLEPVPDGAVADLSFRSITEAASAILKLTSQGYLIALVKPQFELENPDDSFNGIVENGSQILEVAFSVLEKLYNEGAFVENVALSPVKGRKGNQELLFLIRDRETSSLASIKSKLQELLESN